MLLWEIKSNQDCRVIFKNSSFPNNLHNPHMWKSWKASKILTQMNSGEKLNLDILLCLGLSCSFSKTLGNRTHTKRKYTSRSGLVTVFKTSIQSTVSSATWFFSEQWLLSYHLPQKTLLKSCCIFKCSPSLKCLKCQKAHQKDSWRKR